MNDQQTNIELQAMINDYKKSGLNYRFPVMLGVNSLRKNEFADFIDLKHILMGGSTGSGKSNFAHALILSFIMRFSPEEIKFLLIDMKRVEFNMYNSSPYLLTECIVESEVAVKWLKKVLVDKKTSKVTTPTIFIIIDTFSDIMASNQKNEFITLIKEITREGSNLGIHLIMFDSRVGEDIFNLLFISKIETHICFNVVDKVASQLLINSNDGALLLGKGDAIITRTGKAPMRMQTPYITEEEIQKLLIK